MAQWLGMLAALPGCPTLIPSIHVAVTLVLGYLSPSFGPLGYWEWKWYRHTSRQTSIHISKAPKISRTNVGENGRIQLSLPLCWHLESNSALSTKFINYGEHKH